MPVRNNSRFTSESLATREQTSPYARKAKEQALIFLANANERRRSRTR